MFIKKPLNQSSTMIITFELRIFADALFILRLLKGFKLPADIKIEYNSIPVFIYWGRIFSVTGSSRCRLQRFRTVALLTGYSPWIKIRLPSKINLDGKKRKNRVKELRNRISLWKKIREPKEGAGLTW